MGKRPGSNSYLATQLISTREVFSSPSYQSLGLLPALRRRHRARRQRAADRGHGLRRSGRIIRAVSAKGRSASRINFILNANEVVPQDQVMASLRLFAKEVMPVFAKQTGERRRRGGE